MAVRRPMGGMLKRFETRGWQPDPGMIGQRLAICAAKTQVDPDTREKLRDRWMALVKRKVGYCACFSVAGFDNWDDLPFGAVLCHGVLTRVVPTEKLLGEFAAQRDPFEEDWGNYSPGRFGWELSEVVVLARPIPIIGRQGVFWWDEKEAA
jgi:hypothetical protein